MNHSGAGRMTLAVEGKAEQARRAAAASGRDQDGQCWGLTTATSSLVRGPSSEPAALGSQHSSA